MLKYAPDPKKLAEGRNQLVLCAPYSFYKNKWHHKVLGKKTASDFDTMMKNKKIKAGGTQLTHNVGKDMREITLITLKDEVSHSNSSAQKYEIFKALSQAGLDDKASVIFGLKTQDHQGAASGTCARLVRTYNRKQSAKPKTWTLACASEDGKAMKWTTRNKALGDATIWTCELIDTPPEEMNPTTYGKAIKDRFKSISGVKYSEMVGDRLLKENMGGAHAVGRCAPEKPRVVILEWKGGKDADTILLVGKGVTYDTGGLNLKISGYMSEMKCDMGGSAAVLGAFETLVKDNFKHNLIAIVGLVENSIGPDAYRPDDILKMHSGKTVEINNTDAEGRLVLADCISYAARKYKPSLALEAATLTGAQLVATGIRHAGFVSNNRKIEDLARECGERCGDIVYPMPFAPEFFQEEFSSTVADMKNSVKNRMNAQSSCAAQFVYSHIDDLKLDWGHIDLAGPSFQAGRATGYGVGLLVEMAQSYE